LDLGVARGFRPVDRDTGFLLPPDMRDWLPKDHLVWTVIDAVETLDRTALIAAYPLGGRGRRAYDPTMMLTLLIYAYAVGVRSSRRIEAACEHDAAFRIITGNQHPDHDTIAAFRIRHRDHLAGLFVGVLQLCREVGLVRVGGIAIDGTKMRANASGAANRTAAGIEKALVEPAAPGPPAREPDLFAGVVSEVLDDAERTDTAEDAEHGPGRRGDEPPEDLTDHDRRRAAFREAQTRLAAAEAAKAAAHQAETARYQQRMAEREQFRAEHGHNPTGRPPKEPSAPGTDKPLRVNTTDPDSRPMRTAQGFLQGFNSQVAVSDDQIVIGLDVVTDANDTAQLAPMTATALDNLSAAGITGPVQTVTADAGYFNHHQLRGLQDAHRDGRGPEPLVPPNRDALRDPDAQQPPTRQSRPAKAMRERLADPEVRARYARRGVTVEPVFGQIKNLTGDRFLLRGLAKVRAEFTLMTIAHNLRKLHAATTASPAT
jgi:transposase